MKFALGIEYNGTDFYGWQAQENLPTIQGALENALSNVADETIKTFCAGRTDAGVHALEQVIHFETNIIRDPRAWTLGVNSHLPKEISVKWLQLVNDDFHARFSATARQYRYVIYNHPLRSALLTTKALWFYQPLEIVSMQLAGNMLLGEHDFSSFRSSQCESRSPMRHVQAITVSKLSDFIIIEIKANAFLHHMVRNIIGVLLQIGTGRKSPDWMQSVLTARDRKQAAETASAGGLYLQKVFYPIQYNLPEKSQAHFIL